ncbi:hypothetical protein PS15m_007215 [Mucor circinelloides]
MAFWASFFKYTASIFAFCALVLQFFTLIGNTYNVKFLKLLYIARLTKNGQDFIDFGLWNACTGTNGTVLHCNTPKPAYVWTAESSLTEFIGSPVGGYDKVFLANFILYWCGLALTLFAFVFSVSTHYNRITDSMAAMATCLAFLVLFAVFVILIVVAYRVIGLTHSHNATVQGSIGSATWMTLGAMAALLLATIYYGLGCFFRAKRARTYEKV